MTTLISANTITSFLSMQVTPPFDVLIPHQCKAEEAISRLPAYTLTCGIPKDGLKSLAENQDKILNQPVNIQIQAAIEVTPKYFNGVVTAIHLDPAHQTCKLTIKPELSKLEQSCRNRVFLNQKPFDVVHQVIQEQVLAYSTTFKLAVPDSIVSGLVLNAKKEMLMQYQESDLAFISRLLSHMGLFYYFTYDEGVCTMHFVTGADQVKHLKTPIGLDNTSQMARECMTSWVKHSNVSATNVVVDDYNPDDVQVQLKTGEVKDDKANVMVFPAGVTTRQQSQQVASNVAASIQSQQQYYKGTTGRLDLYPGMCFSLLDEGNGDIKDYLVTEMVATAHGHKQHVSAANNLHQNQYSCHVVAVEATTSYQPVCSFQKPQVYALQTATVVAPLNKTQAPIQVDNMGRVKIQFPWESVKHTADSAAWVRVLQPNAGKNWGMLWVPRQGDEVLVSFLNGDIDHPIIVGSSYNSLSTTPIDLHDSPYQTIIKMTSIDGQNKDASRYNELSFNNEIKNERVTLKAERDLTQVIQKDAVMKVTGKSTTTVEQGNMLMHVESGMLVAKAAKGITLQVGNSKIVMDKLSMQLIAPIIKLNPSSTGSAKAVKSIVDGADKLITEKYGLIKNDLAGNE
jgi:type VI secretion system secreted protein VgrG